MSDDNNPEQEGEHARTDESTGTETTGQDSAGGFSKGEWEQLPSDPDPKRDLNYELGSWEQFRTLDGTDQLMFLPEDEELLREDAFLVADEDVVVNLGSKC